MPAVFVNYRTGDGDGSAALIERELSHRFDSKKIFRASKSIPLGENFEKVLLQAVRRSDVLLAVIGPRWLTALDSQGRRALDNEADWTRREILEAFACGVRVIPVLIGSTPRLIRSDLPPELAELASRQSVRFSHTNVEADVTRLADELARLVPALADEPPAPAPERAEPATTSSAIIMSEKVEVSGDLFGGNKYGGAR